MKKKVIDVRVIIDGATPDEAFIIQYAVSQVLNEVQECLNAFFNESEVNK